MNPTDNESPLALVIEDDPNLSEIYLRAVKSAGFLVEAFLDGKEALDALETRQPKVIILDLHLPNVGGNKILDYVRSEERLKDTKVVLVTADTVMASYLDADSDLTLLKPVSYQQLRDLAIRLREMA